MDISIFYARLLGLYMLIIGTEMLLRKNEMTEAVKDIASSKGLIAVSGSIAILLGLSIIILHPMGFADYKGLITILGVLMVIKGIIRFSFPDYIQHHILTMVQDWYYFLIICMFLLGGFLTYSGFV